MACDGAACSASLGAWASARNRHASIGERGPLHCIHGLPMATIAEGFSTPPRFRAISTRGRATDAIPEGRHLIRIAAVPDGRIVKGADSTMIRKATRADRPRISDIRFAVRENRASNPALIESLTDWVFDNSTFWVWEEEGAIQGFSAADPRDGSICALFVHPLYERRGIGRALLPLACDVLKESGHATAVLTIQ